MVNVSNEFAAAMREQPYIARITLDGADVLQGDVIQEIYFRDGSNSSEDALLLGSAFSASVEITMDQDLVACEIEDRELFVELGIALPTGTEWVPMGRYTAGDPAANDGVLTVTAMDDLGAKLDVAFEPLEGFDFSTDEGVPSVDFLAALCARRGVPANVDGLTPIPLKGSPEGFSERQIVGFIAALYGGFAKMDRLGVLRVCTYAKTDAIITADDFYTDGLEKATYSFTPGWLKCHNEAADLTMIVGDMDAAQGINLQSIWMTQAVLSSLWEELQAFTYQPVPELSFFGNPLIDPGDIITLEDTAGTQYTVPVMNITHEYDGGLMTSIAARGQAKTTEYTGPTRQVIIRESQKAANAESRKLDQLELLKRLTKEWVDDGIYLTEDGKIGINASAILTGLLASVDGKIQIDLNGGESGPVFNTGISTNGVNVRGDIADAPTVFSFAAEKAKDTDVPYANMVMRSVSGQMIARLTEIFADEYQRTFGVAFRLYDQQNGNNVNVYANEAESGILMGVGDNMYGAIRTYFNDSGAPKTALEGIERINPGKKVLYSGSVTVGTTFEVPNTADYDLFAVTLADDSGNVAAANILAYKSNGSIRGVGGWCGTSTDQKQLFFLSVDFDGDTWTLVDAGKHNIPMSGGVASGTRLQLYKVIGVI